MNDTQGDKAVVDMLKKHGFSTKEAIKRMDMFCSFEVEREMIGGK